MVIYWQMAGGGTLYHAVPHDQRRALCGFAPQSSRPLPQKGRWTHRPIHRPDGNMCARCTRIYNEGVLAQTYTPGFTT